MSWVADIKDSEIYLSLRKSIGIAHFFAVVCHECVHCSDFMLSYCYSSLHCPTEILKRKKKKKRPFYQIGSKKSKSSSAPKLTIICYESLQLKYCWNEKKKYFKSTAFLVSIPVGILHQLLIIFWCLQGMQVVSICWLLQTISAHTHFRSKAISRSTTSNKKTVVPRKERYVYLLLKLPRNFFFPGKHNF